ncbi:MAG TPA: hypothetical protein VL200_08935 [Lacunisphaera sp.]|jgi:hypothetical protein|nr:hypothetical protein [Lacunisphaera sp.]
MKHLSRLLPVVLSLLALVVVRGADQPAGAAATAQVAGTWHCEIETPQGKGTPTFTFTQDDTKLTGHYQGFFGEAPVTGSVQGNAITFTFKASGQNGEVEMTYTGTVAGDTMKGKAKLGDFGDADFTGRREPAKK